MPLSSIHDSNKVISCILIAVCCVASCGSKSINKDGEKHAIMHEHPFEHRTPYNFVTEHLLEHQTWYNFIVTQDYAATNAPHHCRSPGWYDNVLICINDKAHLRVGFCATYDKKSDIASIALCPYFQPDVFHVIEHNGAHYITLPDNSSDINDFMCRPMNRKGKVCSECMEGYGPAVMSVGFNIQCSNCTGVWYGVPLFLFLEFIPITVFYFIILIFRVDITSGSITCFIMYSQLLVIAYDRIVAGDDVDLTDIMLTATPNSKLVLKILLTIYDIWNLRFFRYLIPPFCISSTLKPIHLVFISYISVFYPLCLIAITWLCIELHDCNFRPLVWMCRPFLSNHCFIRLRRRWNPRNDFVSVFASFFLLSFSKVLFQLLFFLMYQTIDHIVYSTGKVYHEQDVVVEFDLSVPYGGNKQIVFTVISVLLFCILNLLPTLLLVLYPFRFFQALLSKCRRVQIPLERFVRVFNSCYKDGQDGGIDMRSFAGLYFIVRLVLFLTNGIGGVLIITKHYPFLSRNILFTITGLLIALFRPYKETYMNVLATLLLAHIGISCHLMSSYAGFEYQANFVIAFEVMTAIPLAGVLIFFLVKTIRRIIGTQAPQILFQRCKHLCRFLSGIRNTYANIATNDDRVIERAVVGISESDPHDGSINQLPNIAF